MRILSLRSGMTERQRIVEDIVICTHADDRSRVGCILFGAWLKTEWRPGAAFQTL